MPDPTSPFDDPFADLFGKLPDPRERRSTLEDAAHAGHRAVHADPDRDRIEPDHAPLTTRGPRSRRAPGRTRDPASDLR